MKLTIRRLIICTARCEARAALLAQLYENAQHLLNRKPTCWQRIGA